MYPSADSVRNKGIYDKFTKIFAEKVASTIKIGSPDDSSASHGPLISTRAVAKVESILKDAVSRGAKVLTGGQALPKLGDCYFDATVLVDIDQSMMAASEEIFGPIAAFYKFETEDEVLKHANNVPVGLAGYVYSMNLGTVWRMAERLQGIFISYIVSKSNACTGR